MSAKSSEPEPDETIGTIGTISTSDPPLSLSDEDVPILQAVVQKTPAHPLYPERLFRALFESYDAYKETHDLDPGRDANCFRAIVLIGGTPVQPGQPNSLTAKFENFLEQVGIQLIYSDHPSLQNERGAVGQTEEPSFRRLRPAPTQTSRHGLTERGLQALQSSLIAEEGSHYLRYPGIQGESGAGMDSFRDAGDEGSEPTPERRPMLRRFKTEVAHDVRLEEWHRSASQIRTRTGRALSEDGTLARISPRKRSGLATKTLEVQSDPPSTMSPTRVPGTRRSSVGATPFTPNKSNLTQEFAAVLAHRRAKGIPPEGRRRGSDAPTESLAASLAASQLGGEGEYEDVGEEDEEQYPEYDSQLAVAPQDPTIEIPFVPPEALAADIPPINPQVIPEWEQAAHYWRAVTLFRMWTDRWLNSLQEQYDREDLDTQIALQQCQTRLATTVLDQWRARHDENIQGLEHAAELFIAKKWQQKWHSRWFLIEHQNRLPKWFFKEVFRKWRSKTQGRLRQDEVEVPDLHRPALLRRVLQEWRARTQMVVQAEGVANLLNRTVMNGALDRIHDIWYQKAMEGLMAERAHVHRLASEQLSAWRMAAATLKFAQMQARIRARHVLQSWRHQTRLLYLLRSRAAKKDLPLHALATRPKQSSKRPPIDPADQTQFLILQATCLQSWQAARFAQRRNEQLARYYREPVLYTFFRDIWLARLRAIQKFPAWAQDARFFFLSTKVLKTWRQQAHQLRREKRKVAFGEVRRRAKLGMVKRCLICWKEQTLWVQESEERLVGEQIETIELRRLKAFVQKWQERTRAVRVFEVEGAQIQAGLAKRHTLRLWRDQFDTIVRMEETARGRDDANLEESAATLLRRWSMINLSTRALQARVDLFREKQQRGHLRNMISHWQRRSRILRPTAEDESEMLQDTFLGVSRLGISRAPELDPFSMSELGISTPARPAPTPGQQQATRMPGPSTLPGYLGTPSRRANRARGLLRPGSTPATVGARPSRRIDGGSLQLPRFPALIEEGTFEADGDVATSQTRARFSRSTTAL